MTTSRKFQFETASTKTYASDERILGREWADIQRAQKGGRLDRRVDVSRPGDYGADPLGDGRFRMVPSGDVVDLAERNRRLGGAK